MTQAWWLNWCKTIYFQPWWSANIQSLNEWWLGHDEVCLWGSVGCWPLPCPPLCVLPPATLWPTTCSAPCSASSTTTSSSSRGRAARARRKPPKRSSSTTPSAAPTPASWTTSATACCCPTPCWRLEGVISYRVIVGSPVRGWAAASSQQEAQVWDWGWPLPTQAGLERLFNLWPFCVESACSPSFSRVLRRNNCNHESIFINLWLYNWIELFSYRLLETPKPWKTTTQAALESTWTSSLNIR